MTVKELIEKLEKIENKDLPVRLWTDTFSDYCVGGVCEHFGINIDCVSLGCENDVVEE